MSTRIPEGKASGPVCSECSATGRIPERIYPGPGVTTLKYCQPFYDADGRLHNHDSNTRTVSYSCSNGHRWTAREGGWCWCGWKGKI